MGTDRIALVTSDGGAGHDEDLPLLVEALRADGCAAEAVPWDEDSVRWDRFDLAVIRSTWDYVDRLGEFLAWADATAHATRLRNPAPVVRWNSDKHYLRHLAERGVPVVPTRWLEPGHPCSEADVDAAGGVVVKPVVSLGARDTARYEPDSRADAVRHARMLLDQGRAVMIQPYLHRVAEGERALAFFSGTFSHAIRKQPLLSEPGVIDNDRAPHPGVTRYKPTETETRTALQALAAVPAPDPLLFARVDLALNEAGDPVVMELELIEPNLFLRYDPQAVERFAESMRTECRRRL